MWVTTKANAPGGQRTEKVGLPYDPELFDHMVEHGVAIEVRGPALLLQSLCSIRQPAPPVQWAKSWEMCAVLLQESS